MHYMTLHRLWNAFKFNKVRMLNKLSFFRVFFFFLVFICLFLSVSLHFWYFELRKVINMFEHEIKWWFEVRVHLTPLTLKNAGCWIHWDTVELHHRQLKQLRSFEAVAIDYVGSATHSLFILHILFNRTHSGMWFTLNIFEMKIECTNDFCYEWKWINTNHFVFFSFDHFV